MGKRSRQTSADAGSAGLSSVSRASATNELVCSKSVPNGSSAAYLSLLGGPD